MGASLVLSVSLSPPPNPYCLIEANPRGVLNPQIDLLKIGIPFENITIMPVPHLIALNIIPPPASFPISLALLGPFRWGPRSTFGGCVSESLFPHPSFFFLFPFWQLTCWRKQFARPVEFPRYWVLPRCCTLNVFLCPLLLMQTSAVSSRGLIWFEFKFFFYSFLGAKSVS